MMSLQRERAFIVRRLVVLVAASWVILRWQSGTAQGVGGGLTMGMGAALFLAIWGRDDGSHDVSRRCPRDPALLQKLAGEHTGR
jgi:hypothetical protein